MEGPTLEDDEVRDLGQEAAWSLSSAKQGNGALVSVVFGRLFFLGILDHFG